MRIPRKVHNPKRYTVSGTCRRMLQPISLNSLASMSDSQPLAYFHPLPRLFFCGLLFCVPMEHIVNANRNNIDMTRDLRIRSRFRALFCQDEALPASPRRSPVADTAHLYGHVSSANPVVSNLIAGQMVRTQGFIDDARNHDIVASTSFEKKQLPFIFSVG